MKLLGITIKTIVLLTAFVWLSGCVQTKSVPGYARSGDFIVLGLGGIDRNSANTASLSPADLTITVTDSGGNTYPLGAINIFRSYPDYNSSMNALAVDSSVGPFNDFGITTFDGGWFAVVPLSVPGDLNTTYPLTVGDATISITSPKLINTTLSLEGDLTSIPIEIISGVTPPDLNYLRQFGIYSPNPDNFVISPSSLGGATQVGGAYFVIDYSDDSFFEAGVEPMIVPTNHNPYVQLSYNLVSNGDGTGAIYVTLLNPAGFDDAGPTNASRIADLDIRLVYFADEHAPTDAESVFSLDAESSYYIGTDGALLSGATPIMVHASTL